MPTPNPDSFGSASSCEFATVDYFTKIFGFREALELSNIDSPKSNKIDNEKIQLALNDAAVLINNYINTAPPQGKLLIAGSYRRTQAILARCYLDTLRPRQQVQDACEKALQQLELWASKTQPSSALRWQEAMSYWGGDGCGFVRSQFGRSRAFTDASMFAWQALHGANNRRNYIAPLDAQQPWRESIDRGSSMPEPTGQIDENLLKLNQLFDLLEQTRSLSNFEDTQGLVPDAEDQDLIIHEEDEFVAKKPAEGLSEGYNY